MTSTSAPIRVLFVCLGNICRSPMAEGVFRKLVHEAGLEGRFEIDSAGIGSWHTGEPPDERATATAGQRGVLLSGSARQVRAADLGRFDYVLAMDEENLAALRRLARSARRARAQAGDAASVPAVHSPTIRLFREFDAGSAGADDLDVPDPYYGGPGGFDHVFDLVEAAARGLLAHIRKERGL